LFLFVPIPSLLLPICSENVPLLAIFTFGPIKIRNNFTHFLNWRGPDFVREVGWAFCLLSIFSGVLRYGEASAQRSMAKPQFQVNAGDEKTSCPVKSVRWPPFL
jgi:hypothetical protein